MTHGPGTASEATAVRKVNLAEGFAAVREPWTPRIAADVNDAQLKLVRLRGSFVWHHHEAEDELFLVVNGRMRMRVRDSEGERDVQVDPGEFVLIPRGVEHCPVADGGDCEVLLVEPNTTLNTGNVRDERTIEAPGRL